MALTEFEIRNQLILANAKKDAQKYDPYVLSRGLDYYEESLPKYTQFGLWRRGFASIIKERSFFGRQTRILDVGCGTGTALSQLKSSALGDQIEAWGISCTDFRVSENDGINHYIVADIHDPELKGLIPPNYFDILMGYQSFIHFGDPIQALENCWEFLKPHGFGFIDSVGRSGMPLYWEGIKIPTYLLIKLLQFEGYSFQIDPYNESRENDLAFRKNRSHLKLPVEYTGEIEEDQAWKGFGKVAYRWSSKMPNKIARNLPGWAASGSNREPTP